MSATTPKVIDPSHSAVVAADYIEQAVGPFGALTVLQAIRADWLTPAEADHVAPLAAGLGFVLGARVSAHRDVPCPIRVGRR